MTLTADRATRARETTGGKGQWALGETEPLNANERFKREDDALNVRARIEQTYSKQGFASIPTEDLHGRFRWWGLYTQRKQGLDGRQTGHLEPHELEDEYFMLRVRVDGGALTTGQLRAIGEVSRDYARDSADITDRQNIQLHWVRVEDVPAIWERLEGVGLLTTEACGDCPRVVLGSPVAGISKDELLDPTWAIEEIQRRYVGNPDFSNLPRKFKSAITGMLTNDVVHEINDISFVGVRHPELGPGFDLWVGGGLSTNPRLAERLGVFVREEEVPDVWAAVTSIFRDYGYRRLRHKARLKFLLADWGAERFREVLEQEYLGRALPDGPAPEPTPDRGDHVGAHEQKDGKFYVGVAPTVGRVSGTLLLELADLVESYGSQRVRLTPHQKLLVLDVPRRRVNTLTRKLAALGLEANPSVFRRHTMACTGIEFCKLAYVDTKGMATRTIGVLEERLADVIDEIDVPLSIHVNGCPNSCARIQVADIGLKGQLVKDADGEEVEGFQVHLGGTLGLDAGFGRKVRGLKTTAAEAPAYIERVVRNFVKDREPGERFATWALRADEELLV
ncbi:nitrite/sulfite reductase [Oryzihumus leptocrescens]|uniref:assimilatory sulfite reductase (ferredoxin) n=1 Tax=Oryzihumus leptocrescens TaxID=297536 RepID=A0A542ZP37_9MICO|nr:nitrite/sulfite reductase [Oryzihumus leptocrescens]TQL61970.1 sulfite reductase (ferredoxin) [Oryzihumus leptocrescens]